MPLPMIMIAVLHEVLLMVILPMLLPLIKPIKIEFQDIPNLAEHLSVIHFSQSATTSSLLQYVYFNIQNIIPQDLASDNRYAGVFPKRKAFVIFSKPTTLSY